MGDVFDWGKGSLHQIGYLHPDLIRGLELLPAILRAASDGVPAKIVQSLRSETEAQLNARKKKGIVASLHCRQPDGYVHAFDYCAAVKRRAYDMELIRIIRGAIFQAYDSINVVVRNGGDWDADAIETHKDPTEKGNIADFVHFELVPPGHFRYGACVTGIVRRNALRSTGERWPL